MRGDPPTATRVPVAGDSGARSAPPYDEHWRPDEDTRTTGPLPVRAAQRSLGRELHDATSFSGHSLLLAVLGSVVGTVLAGSASAGPWGTLAGAAVTPVVSTTFAARRAGDRGRVAAVAIVLLSAAALIITVTGVSLADLATGKSVLPGNGGQSGSFPGVDAGSEPASSTAEEPQTSPPPPASGSVSADPVDCGAVAVGSTTDCHPGAVLVYTGEGQLKITSVEIVGADAGDFAAGSECVGTTLESGSSCETGISLTASGPGPRQATLVIHQSLPAPDRGTHVDLAGIGQDSTTDPGSCPTDAPSSGCPSPSPPS
jgi:hypothetical protein